MNSFLIGTIAGALCAISFLPQLVKIIKTKNTRDLSLITFSMLSAGIFLWLIYGIMIRQAPIIMANSAILVLSVLILIMKIRYK